MDTRKISPIRRGKDRGENLADRIYNQLKQDIFEFRLLPGDRFSENEIAERVQASRTPVREALFRLQREGYVDVLYRSGWQIRPFDFKSFEDLYDVRIIIETAAVKRLCEMEVPPATLNDLKQIWLVPAGERLSDGATVSQLDERFHEMLVEGTGNVEMAQMHHAVTERIRIIRRLDFTKPPRIDATYTSCCSRPTSKKARRRFARSPFTCCTRPAEVRNDNRRQ